MDKSGIAGAQRNFIYKGKFKMTTSNLPTLAEARRNLQKAWELYNSHMPLEEWRRVVRPEVAAWAVKEHGSLEAAYSDALDWAFKCLALTYEQWEAAEARRQSRSKSEIRK